MSNWTKMGTDVGVGAAGGVASKLAGDYDVSREAKLPAGQKLSFLSRIGNYVDYGVPLLAVIGSAVGFLRDPWETRLLVMGGTLAGRNATGLVKSRIAAPAAWRPMGPSPQYSPPAPGPSPTTRAWAPRVLSS